MKEYTFQVTITEQSDEFWEDITKDGKTGCDEVLQLINDMLQQNNLEFTTKLISYKDK
jgi:hypothetical protein